MENAKQTTQGSETPRNFDSEPDDHCYRLSEGTPRLISLDAFDPFSCSGDHTLPVLSSESPSTYLSSVRQAPAITQEPHYPLTVLGALFINGQLLGMTCGAPVAAKSLPVSPDVPLSLHPTATQLLIIHFTGIDRFPFPKMRDNVINMSAVIDEEEFSRDLFLMPSFSITPGAAPWDPKAWSIEKPFADKWGFLFY